MRLNLRPEMPILRQADVVIRVRDDVGYLPRVKWRLLRDDRGSRREIENAAVRIGDSDGSAPRSGARES